MLMMIKKYLTLCLVPMLFSFVSAKEALDCRIVTTGISSCNPYSTKLLFSKEIVYKKDNKKLIVSKILPVPKKKHVKVVSVIDMIEKYVKIEKPIRYEASDHRELEALHIESAKDSNRYSIAEEMEQRRKKFIEKLAAEQKKAYAKQLKEAVVCIETNATLTVDDENQSLAQIEIVDEVNQTVATTKVPEELIAKVEGFYIVEKGDTLSSIAKKFRVPLSELKILNQMEKEKPVKVGEQILLAMKQETIDIIAKAEYIIKPGDGVSMIARDFNLSSSDILKYNQLEKTSTICIGKKLILPFPYKIASLEKKREIRLAKEKKEAKKSRRFRRIGKKKLRVTATAYSSHRGQTDKTPFLAAWNNRIRPGMKIIAVSRDMLTRYGLRNGSKVRIGGLPGYYTVRDKMNKRYRKRIDIYMGTNRRRALRWGRRSVVIYF